MKKIGILGGTFDPPHYGHLIIAEEVYHALSLDEVWFMPTNTPPHKEEASSAGVDRIKMVQAAIKDNQKFTVETIEFERSGPSYTYETIKLLAKKHENKQFHFIIGADMVEYLPNWHEIDRLVEMITFVSVKRPGFSIASSFPIIEVEIPQFDVSSSFLRDRFRNGKNTKYFLPDEVQLYIEEKNLYGPK
jgi:nicotinate-nucleotide adenylyltransferase